MNTNASSSTTSQWLEQATDKLSGSNIGTARLDCLVLLEDVTGKDRTHLLAHPELELTNEQVDKLNSQITRRAKHEPLAYIRGKTEFYGREFLVDHRVLEPRPESETMIGLLKQLVDGERLTVSSPHIVDVGTGSGALGITAALELIQCQVTLIDIDKGCLDVAELNRKKHQVTAALTQGDLLEPLLSNKNTERLENLIILANLPYVPDEYHVNEAALNEPRIAIFGGKDGLDLYRKLFEQLRNFEHFQGYILTESLPFQHEALVTIAKSNGFNETAEDDFIQAFSL